MAEQRRTNRYGRPVEGAPASGQQQAPARSRHGDSRSGPASEGRRKSDSGHGERAANGGERFRPRESGRDGFVERGASRRDSTSRGSGASRPDGQGARGFQDWKSARSEGDRGGREQASERSQRDNGGRTFREGGARSEPRSRNESLPGQDRERRANSENRSYAGARPERPGRPERFERGARSERPESGRQPRFDRAEGGDRGRPQQFERPERERQPSFARHERGERDGAAPRHAEAQQEQGARPDRPRLHPLEFRIKQLDQLFEQVFTWEYPADATLSHWLRGHPQLGGRDRAQVAEALYDVLRHLRRYRHYAESGTGPAHRRLAILSLASTMGREALQPILSTDEAAWLERLDGIDAQTLPLAVRQSYPEWLAEALSALPDGEALMAALNQPAGLDLRVNPMKADRDEALATLCKSMPQFHPQATPYSPWGIRVQGRPALQRSPLFEHGLIEVQDEGSQLLALLVGPKRGEMVIDFCAGAGGKTLLLGALMRSTGRLYAFDVSAARLARAKPRLARSGLSNVATIAIEHENDVRVKRLAGKAQRVLVDAPCSGIGTLRRNPDMKWRQSSQSVRELCDIQARVLESAARCVAPGGRLIYATCSLLPQENEAQVEAFLSKHPEFRLLDAGAILEPRAPGLNLEDSYLRLRPDRHGTDGFFAAALERSSGEA